MTASELIKILQAMPPDAQVMQKHGGLLFTDLTVKKRTVYRGRYGALKPGETFTTDWVLDKDLVSTPSNLHYVEQMHAAVIDAWGY